MDNNLDNNELIEIGEKEKTKKKKHGLFYTKKEPRKAMSTFLRNQNKFMISSVAIADRKSMILIRLNSSIVTGAIVFHEYIDTNVPLGQYIGLVLIIGMTISLVLAILVAKPANERINNILKNEIEPIHPKLSDNSFFLSKKTSIQDYEAALDEIVNSQELQIGNQIRAHYLLNINVGIGFRLLDIAYNFFLGTFVLVAIIFIIGRFFM